MALHDLLADGQSQSSALWLAGLVLQHCIDHIADQAGGISRDLFVGLELPAIITDSIPRLYLARESPAGPGSAIRPCCQRAHLWSKSVQTSGSSLPLRSMARRPGSKTGRNIPSIEHTKEEGYRRIRHHRRWLFSEHGGVLLTRTFENQHTHRFIKYRNKPGFCPRQLLSSMDRKLLHLPSCSGELPSPMPGFEPGD